MQQQMTISEKAAAANLANQAWTEYRRHVEAGNIVGSVTVTALREGRYAEALTWLTEARDSDWLTRPVRVPAHPNRHRLAARAKDRVHARRQTRRADKRAWRTEWDFALRAVAA